MDHLSPLGLYQHTSLRRETENVYSNDPKSLQFVERTLFGASITRRLGLSVGL